MPAPPRDHSVILGMVVGVAHEGIEDYPTKHIHHVRARVGGIALKLVRELEIGPSRPSPRAVVGAQDAGGTQHAVPHEHAAPNQAVDLGRSAAPVTPVDQ